MNTIRLVGGALAIILGGIWGWFQVDLFPMEKFGVLFILTAAIGGLTIGWLIRLLVDFIEENYVK